MQSFPNKQTPKNAPAGIEQKNFWEFKGHGETSSFSNNSIAFVFRSILTAEMWDIVIAPTCLKQIEANQSYNLVVTCAFLSPLFWTIAISSKYVDPNICSV